METQRSVGLEKSLALLVCGLVISAGFARSAAGQFVTNANGISDARFDSSEPYLALNFALQVDGPTGLGVPVRMFAFGPTNGTWRYNLPGSAEPFAAWMPPDGRTLSSQTHPVLFQQLNATFGSPGAGQFRIPDLRGKSIVGEGGGPGLEITGRGDTLGAEYVTLTEANLPAHTHTLGQQTSTSSGGGQPFNNRSPNYGLNVVVMNTGAYPTQSGLPNPTLATPAQPLIGQIQFLCVSAPNAGYLPARGTELNINSNTALYSIIGTLYGVPSSPQTRFIIPEARGRSLAGQSFNTAVPAGLTPRALGSRYGAESITLTPANLPPHRHAMPTNMSTSSVGSAVPIENVGPQTAVTYCIAYTGTYPASGSSMSASTAYIGEVIAFAGNYAPDGYFPCDGRSLPIAQYESLFTLIGFFYGGDGETTFAIPDLRSRVPVMATSTKPMSTADGREQVTLGILSMPRHTHEFARAGCQAADIACDSGSLFDPAFFFSCTNNGVNEGDYNGFFSFNGFFNQAGRGSAAIGTVWDIAYDSGDPLPPFGAVIPNAVNNGVNEGDYNCFFNNFFLGCTLN
ncbi:MAG: tail fiber protein [Phycisphaerales bacterium]|nr:tail fiber protein [Phycisphaerales bacterium]